MLDIYQLLLKCAREKNINARHMLLKHAREKEKNTPVPDMCINVAEMCNRKGKKKIASMLGMC